MDSPSVFAKHHVKIETALAADIVEYTTARRRNMADAIDANDMQKNFGCVQSVRTFNPLDVHMLKDEDGVHTTSESENR